jgi:hypothetical protein
MFENRALRRISGPKAAKLTGGRRGLHNEELHNLYSSPSIMRMIKSMRHVTEKKKCFWGVERSRHVRLTALPPSVSRLSR